MKISASIMFLTFVLGCGATQLRETDKRNIEKAPDGLKANTPLVIKGDSLQNKKDIVFSDAGGIKEIMTFLASDELQGRDSGSKGINKAAEFIETIFTKNNIKPYFSSFKDTLSNFKKTTYNMVGYVEGNDANLKNEFVIVGAHYDHIGLINAQGGDKVANGANDNASGTTAVLEFARYFGNTKTNKRSIIFALFSAEEKGLLGSKHLAKRLKNKNLNLYAMLNFEMVGVPLADKDYLMYVTGYETSNLATISNTYAKENLVGYLPTAKKFNLFKRSDNFPFHEIFKVPSQTYCTFDFTNFSQYHKVGDENELMDFDHMATLVNKTIPVLQGILNADTQELQYN